MPGLLANAYVCLYAYVYTHGNYTCMYMWDICVKESDHLGDFDVSSHLFLDRNGSRYGLLLSCCENDNGPLGFLQHGGDFSTN